MLDVNRIENGIREAYKRNDFDKVKVLKAYLDEANSSQETTEPNENIEYTEGGTLDPFVPDESPEETPTRASMLTDSMNLAPVEPDVEDTSPYRSTVDNMSSGERALVGVGRGLTNVGRAAQDGFYRATGQGDALAALNERIGNEEESWNYLKERSTAASLGELGGEVAGTLPLGGALGAGARNLAAKGLAKLAPTLTKTTKAGSLAAEAAVDGAVTAGALQRGDLDTRLDAASKGAFYGVAGTGGIHGAGLLGNKVMNSGKEFTTDLARRADETAEASGVPIHLGDAREGEALNRASSFFNDIPLVGTGGGKLEQHTAATDYVKKQIDGFSEYDDLNDATYGLQKSITDALDAKRTKKNDLYNSFNDELRGFGDLPRTNTNNMLDELIAAEKAAGTSDKGYLAELENLRNAPEGGIDILIKRRNALKDKADAGFKAGNLGSTQSADMGNLRKAMEQDALDFATKIEADMGSELGLMSRAAEAKEFYTTEFMPFKENKVLQHAIKNNEPEGIIRALKVADGSELRAKELYHALNDEGKKRLQSAFLLDSFKKANAGAVFSPKVFRGEMKKLSSTTGVLFKGDDKKVFDGIMDVLEFTQDSAVVASSPMNGSRLMLASVVTSTAAVGGGAQAMVPLVAATALFKIATQNKQARRLLTASSSRSGNTKSMDFTVDYLAAAMRKVTATKSVDDNVQEPIEQ